MGRNIKDIVTGDDSVNFIDADREFYFAKDREDLNVLSCTKDGKIVALKEGTERICLFECEKKGTYAPSTDMLVGVIDISVIAEPVCSSLVLTEQKPDYVYSIDSYDKLRKISWEAYDVDDDPIDVSLEFFDSDGKALDSAWKAGINVQYKNGTTAGKSGSITVNYASYASFDASIEPKEVTVQVKHTDIHETFMIDPNRIDREEDPVTYSVLLDRDKYVVNNRVAYSWDNRILDEDGNPAAENASSYIKIKAVRMYGEVEAETVRFYFISDSDINTASLEEGALYVQITDADGKVMNKGAIGAGIATSGAVTASVGEASFWYFIINMADADFMPVEKAVLAGDYNILLYRVVNGVPVLEDEKETSVTVDVKGIEYVSTVKIEAKDGKIVNKAGNPACWTNSGTATASELEWVTDIVKSLYLFIDEDLDGKASPYEIRKFKNDSSQMSQHLFRFEIVPESSSWIVGANGTDIYIRYVTIRYEVSYALGDPEASVLEQRLNIDAKFATNGFE